MKSASDTLKILIGKIEKSIWVLGLHAFSLIILFIIIDLILGSIVFYNYVFLTEKENPNTTESILRFDDKTYKSVIEKLNNNEEANKLSPISQPPNEKQTGSTGQDTKK